MTAIEGVRVARDAVAGDHRPQRRRRRRHPASWAIGLLLACTSAIWIFPFLWLLSASVKPNSEIFGSGLGLIPGHFVWGNYGRVWSDVRFATYMGNSTLITLGVVALVVFRSALAGYVIGRYKFPGKKTLVGIFLATYFLPESTTIIPVTQLTGQLHLLNSRVGVIMGLGAGGHVAATLLYAGYFAKVPKELEESARLDGAGPFTLFFRVMLPLAKPITATVFILTFLFAWNAYLLPLVFTLGNPDLRTLAVGMTAFVGEQSTDWSGLAAAAVISLAPIVAIFVALQRHFVDSIAGAVKQ